MFKLDCKSLPKPSPAPGKMLIANGAFGPRSSSLHLRKTMAQRCCWVIPCNQTGADRLLRKHPANASEFSESLARRAGRLKATTSWDRVTGKKLIGTLCSIVMLLYVLGAIALGVALLLYTFTQ